MILIEIIVFSINGEPNSSRMWVAVTEGLGYVPCSHGSLCGVQRDKSR